MDLDRHNEWEEATGLPFDTYEQEAEKESPPAVVVTVGAGDLQSQWAYLLSCVPLTTNEEDADAVEGLLGLVEGMLDQIEGIE